MKKVFLLTTIILMTASVANACGGIVVKDKYCLSKHSMNWYSASAWCQAQGMQLVDPKTVCKTISGTCNALKLSTDEQTVITEFVGWLPHAWTNVSQSISNGLRVDWPGAYIGQGANRTFTGYNALCQ